MLTLKDLQRRFKRGRSTIYSWIETRGFPPASTFIGTRKLWSAEAVEAWARANPETE